LDRDFTVKKDSGRDGVQELKVDQLEEEIPPSEPRDAEEEQSLTMKGTEVC
jgi:hypothetical protein